jgi:hypothetical protein
MDKDKLALYKFIGIVFALLIAGSWIWSWINPSDNTPITYTAPTVVESTSTKTYNNPSVNYSNPCEDYENTQDYLNCMEDQALEDWHNDRVAEAGMP